MRVVVTGGAGFIGRAVVEPLAARGDTVVALVRDPGKAAHLERDGVELVTSDLSSVGTMTETLRGADAVAHIAGSYRVGIRPDERDAMWDANVGTTERVLDAAIAAGVPRILYVSTLGVLGDTRGRSSTRPSGATAPAGSCPATTRPSTGRTRPPRRGSPAGRQS